MNTAPLRNFAAKARSELMRGVLNKLSWLGFDDSGRPVENSRPQVFQGGTTWRNEIYPESFGRQWEALARHLESRGVKETVEEGAYTWFNRMMAIRILTKNGLCEPVLQYADNGNPLIVENARLGRIPQMRAERRSQLDRLLADGNKTQAAFALLLTEWCRNNPIIHSCFDSIDESMELLLPTDILLPGGFLHLLNSSIELTDDDYRSSELIGWLYQFYISDRKAEVMKKGKYDADEIPAATQIFTPNWIVKYMVENTILPQVGADSDILEGAKYLVRNDNAPSAKVELEDLKVADLACGSGHILNECFDLLFALYISEGYTTAEAIENIFTRNLTGIDIDLRARQLAKFALMLKAAQKAPEFAAQPIEPQVLTIPDFVDKLATSAYTDENGSRYRAVMHEFYRDSVTENVARHTEATFDLLKDARTLGSIMKFDIDSATRRALIDTLAYWKNKPAIDRPDFVNDFIPAAELILALTAEYDALVMNPPYMPTNKEDTIKTYAAKNYPDSKTDLFAVFMDVCIDRLRDGGKYGMINMQSWMFLSSFEALRKRIIDEQHIDSMLHLGPRTFDELSGEVVQNTAFVITKAHPDNATGIYYRLIDGKSCSGKESMFLAEHGRYANVSQSQFEKIPGCPLGYWISDNLLKAFSSQELTNICETRCGLATGRNERFLRLWYEVPHCNINFGCLSRTQSKSLSGLWYPYDKAGNERKWFGNRDYVVNWFHDGEELQTTMHPDGKRIWAHNFNLDKIFQKHIGWSDIISGKLSFRYFEPGFLFDGSANAVFENINYSEKDFLTILAYSNSCITNYVRELLNPSIHFKPGNYISLPYIHTPSDEFYRLCVDNISISKSDWDAHETSWDFQTSPLLTFGKATIAEALEAFKEEWGDKFRQLHANEEELNRRFIEIYGLQDELTPDVALKEVTILQQGEIEISDDNRVVWHNDVVMQQLISYIVGVWMGRYRLDKPGLNIAHPQPTAEELSAYTYGPDGDTVEIDDDAIIPILPKEAPFEDNLENRIEDFVRIAWGRDRLNENLTYMETALGKSLESYVNKDFWTRHKKMYQNKPIYWLFSSPKGSFKVLVYAHRMTKHTVSLIRSKYLLRYINWLEERVTALDANIDNLATRERKELENMRKRLKECHDYHNRLQQVAEREIAFDLDDGIIHNYALFGDVLAKLK